MWQEFKNCWKVEILRNLDPRKSFFMSASTGSNVRFSLKPYRLNEIQ